MRLTGLGGFEAAPNAERLQRTGFALHNIDGRVSLACGCKPGSLHRSHDAARSRGNVVIEVSVAGFPMEKASSSTDQAV